MEELKNKASEAAMEIDMAKMKMMMVQMQMQETYQKAQSLSKVRSGPSIGFSAGSLWDPRRDGLSGRESL